MRLPPCIRHKRACINVKNRDDKCALWSILASLHPQAQNSDRLSKYAPYEHELNVGNISWPLRIQSVGAPPSAPAGGSV